MKAGRELDIAIAEKVMGLVPCLSPSHEVGAEVYIPLPCHALPDSPDKGEETKFYSTNISDAMEVVDKLRERGLDVLMCGGDTYRWEVEIWRGDEAELATIQSDSLPEGICVAALKTLKESET